MAFECRGKIFTDLICAVSFSTVACSFSYGATHDWRASIAEGDRRMITQELQAAEDQYRQAVKDVKRGGASADDIAFCLEKLAGVLQIEDETEDVVPLYRKALKLLEKAHGAKSMKLVPTLLALGAVSEGEGDYLKSADFYRRAAAITATSIGETSYQYASYEHLVGRALYKAGSYVEAEALYKTSLAIIMQQQNLPSAGLLEELLADYSQLLMKENEQLRISSSNFQTELLKDKVGAHGRTKGIAASAWDMRVSGNLLDDVGIVPKRLTGAPVPSLTPEESNKPSGVENSKPFENSQLFETPQRLETPQRVTAPQRLEAPVPGATDPGLRQVPSDVVTLDQINKQRVEFYERMIAADIDSLGPDHPSVARDLSGLAALYLTQKKYDQAKPLLTRALAIYKKSYGIDRGVVERTQILLYLASKERSNVPAVLDDSYINGLPPVAVQSQKVEVALRFNYLALQCYSQHKFDDALKLYGWALATTVKACGPRSALVACCLTDYGRVLRSCGRPIEAEQYEKSAQSILRLALEKQATAAFP